jgi:hypothetical protein
MVVGGDGNLHRDAAVTAGVLDEQGEVEPLSALGCDQRSGAMWLVRRGNIDEAWVLNRGRRAHGGLGACTAIRRVAACSWRRGAVLLRVVVRGGRLGVI